MVVYILLHTKLGSVFYTVNDNSASSMDSINTVNAESFSSPEEPPKKEPNQKPKQDLKNKTPILPSTYIKLYNDAQESKLDIIKTFKNKTIIYMWFNKITGKVYIGSAVDGAKRMSTYYQASILSKNSLIYNNILKYGHHNFSVIILEVCGERGTVPKDIYIEREQFFIDWALKSYGLDVLNILHVAGSSLDYRHTKQDLLKMSALKLKDKNPMFGKPKSLEFMLHATRSKEGSNNPQFGRTKTENFLAKTRKMIYVYHVTDKYKLLGVYHTVVCTRTFNISYSVLIKRVNDGLIYKDKYFFSREPFNG